MCRVKNAIASVALLFLLMGLVSFASAGTIRHDRPDQAYLDLVALYPSVGHVIFGTDLGLYLASGTLIADDWVLTAAHVVDEANWLDFTIGGDTYIADEWIPYPQWDGDLEAGYDIGLFNLSSPVEDVQPARRYRSPRELGAEATVLYETSAVAEVHHTTILGGVLGLTTRHPLRKLHVRWQSIGQHHVQWLGFHNPECLLRITGKVNIVLILKSQH